VTATILLICGAVLLSMPVIVQPCRQWQGQAAVVAVKPGKRTCACPPGRRHF
jgi:hypothetical protein